MVENGAFVVTLPLDEEDELRALGTLDDWATAQHLAASRWAGLLGGQIADGPPERTIVARYSGLATYTWKALR